MNTDAKGSVPGHSQNDDDRWLSVDEIAAHLGIKRETVYPWIYKKDMPCHKVGRLWKFNKDEVNEWVRSGKAGQKPEDAN